MSGNPDLQKAKNNFFSGRNNIDHPDVHFDNIPVMKVDEYKNLRIIVNSRLSISANIKAAISNQRTLGDTRTRGQAHGPLASVSVAVQ